MTAQLIDTALVVALLMNFAALASPQLRQMVSAVAWQGALLGLAYPLAHEGLAQAVKSGEGTSWLAIARLIGLTAALIIVKGIVIPRSMIRAAQLSGMRAASTSIVGYGGSLVLGAIATGFAVMFARSLPPAELRGSYLVIPASLATAACGFLVLATRREALAQVVGYIILENGIFIFGLLLVEALPVLVEFGVILDLFVGVFVMGIIINHVNRAFPAASSEYLAALKE